MKNYKKGFVIPLVIAIIALLGIGGGGYVYVNKKNADKLENSLKKISKNTVVTSTNIVENNENDSKIIPANTTTSVVSDWKTYKNEEYGFEFEYPKIYEVMYDSHLGGGIPNIGEKQFAIQFQTITNSDYPGQGYLIFSVQPTSFKNIEDLMEQSKNTIDNNQFIKDKWEAIYKNFFGKYAVIIQDKNAGCSHPEEVSIINNGNIFKFNDYLCSIKPYNDNITKIMNSFRFAKDDYLTHIPPPDITNPIITSVTPTKANVGSTLTIKGFNLNGFEGETSLYIENPLGQKIVVSVSSYLPEGSNILKWTVPGQVCTTLRGVQTGEPCPGFIKILPGTYKLKAVPWSDSSNEIYFEII